MDSIYSIYELIKGSIQFPLLEGAIEGRDANHIKCLKKGIVSFPEN
jgi:hypothetical protein